MPANIKKYIPRFIKRTLKPWFMTAEQRRAWLVGPPELWDMKRAFQINYLKSVGLKPSNTLIDIGCGVLRGGLPIIDYLEPGNYTGIEAREAALDEGRRELVQAKLESKRPNLIVHEHLNTLDLNRRVDFVWCFSVLIHLNDTILDEVLGFVVRHLKDDGAFYGNVDTREGIDGRWQEFPAVGRPIAFYVDRFKKAGMSVSDVGSLLELGHESKGVADVNRMLRATLIR